MVENTLKIKLPASAKVEKYTYYNEGGYYNVKLLIEEKQVTDLKNKLNDIFHRSESKKDYDKILNYNSTCSWWDLKEENFVVAYNSFTSSEEKWFKLSPETHDVWAFIIKQDDEKYYLYISY